ncbi:tryptophanyl-tRNA synthetase [Salana multivorans]|uniref:Tryptophan--tRNA ligase n=1 Tax=Salana multivorans TaxID=120377 RepID=A0A3N2D776_9MICO|nr:tryptophan--tRNA ligase [Salana multivorans]ROR95630.1 tryptophanyl-tRNA synthetase [Salana multivorans]
MTSTTATSTTTPASGDVPGGVPGETPDDARSLDRARERSAELADLVRTAPHRLRMLTGDRPTGRLHLGHHLATLRGRLALQEAGVETFVVVADYQVITDRDAPGPLRERVLDVVTDQLALGLDPERTTFFAHSQVPELNELVVPFLSLVTDAELRRNPTVKAEHAASGGRQLSGLLLTYPVHQAADIVFCGANVVPVGKDQLPHLEVARLIVRRFTERYGDAGLVPPDALLTDAVTVLGTDGQKMSKSRGNTIDLAMTADETARVLRRAVTDSERRITYEPERRPEVANLLLVGAMCSGRTPADLAEEIGDGGAGALKAYVTDAVNAELAGLRARRAELTRDPGAVLAALRAGTDRARAVAAATLARVHRALGMTY